MLCRRLRIIYLIIVAHKIQLDASCNFLYDAVSNSDGTASTAGQLGNSELENIEKEIPMV